ncbi:hypothetical protein PHYBOEH_003604 [Phytophthora boehmeriae]|uniref:SAM domain-containing protein n=1 Tax=Phytophthora boehmeriae TaxID=109152 RepID=A0A8T1X6Q5_9STRA|nr:hypothetical protein PHYBOEH_003604 [Phytophthora boehmeriae]
MDWEANLAAVIKCTDANLEQQFRQFEDVTAEFTASPSDPSENVAATYLRESMATDYRQQQQQQREKTPTPSYSRVSSSFARGPATSAPATSFSEHFHRRQERKRGAMKDNQRAEHERQEYGQMPSRNVDERRYAPPAGVYQMYASPTYDVAQMMEQVRLSLKLEVDARAAIAERQLSALLQLCKATSEELDRLRVEVCANDRQLHTIDQVQSKLRQELTTQKDIGFHLQSMCGKDESWRMQTENQLLELRQMVAALREQGNSTQAAAQEKLSRSELLVQFNAAMEPIKAQLQANLQHQAQQIADITRTTSSSSLLLDGITQKVNRGITEEISELRSDLNALKHHVAKMDIFQDPRGQQQDRTSKEELDAQKKKEQQQEEKKMNELREGLLKDVMAQANEYVDSQINLIRQVIDESSAKFIDKKEVERLKGALEEECGKRCAAVVAHVESQMKSSQDIIRDEVKAAIVSAADRMDMSMKQATSTMTTALNGQSSSLQNKLHDVNKVIDKEQKERKQALDELHEALRKNRHNLEDQIHTLTQENRNLTQETRTKLSQHGYELERHVKEMESYMEKSIEHLKGLVTAQVDSKGVEWDHKFMRLEETIVNTNKAVNALSETVAATRSEIPSSDASSKDSSMALEKQTTAYLSTMESMLQKMQLQLQLQAQSQAQVAIAPTPYHGYWPPSPYPSSHPPPPPTLHLPPGVLSSTAPVPGQPPTTTLASSATNTGISPSAVQSDHRAVSNSQENGGNASNALKEKLANDNSAETLLDTFPVRLNSASAARNSTPPVVSQATPIPSLVQQVEVATSLQSAIDNEPNKGSSTDQSNKREGTIAATTKGALAEAELAKARVENRRKQEMETKQQLLQQRRPSLESAQLTKHQLAAVAEIGSRPATAPAPVVIAKRTPITEKAEDERPNIEGKNAPAPVVVAGNASSSVQSPSRQPPPQLTAKPREAAVPPSRVPVLTGAMVTTNSPMPKSMPSAVPVATARSVAMSELQEHIENCDCRLVSCPNDCGGKFLQRGIPNHLATRCPKKPVASAALVAPAPPQTAHPEANKTVASFAATLPSTTLSSAGKVECKFCDDEIDASKIETHEEDCDWRPKRCQHCNMVVISRDLVRHETSMLAPSGRLGADTLVDNHDEEDEDYEDDEDDDQLTLAQVVKEWNVDNVCLWLSEDVGVPEVVQQQCNGEMLLELTESDLINDFGVKSRVHRERILNAIEAIQTSDAFSDDDEDFGDEEDEDGHDESEDNSSTQTRHSAGGASFSHPRDILRRSQPSPQRAIGGSLPSSNDMLRRITNALENPKR